MKKFLLTIFLTFFITQSAMAIDWKFWVSDDEKSVRNLLESQVKYANRTNYEKFISTYSSDYVNADGFNLDTYSSLVKDIWSTYNKIKYDIDIKKVTIDNNIATVELEETANAQIKMSKVYEGELKSFSNTVYKLKKVNGKWKVFYDSILDETTSMLYGDARDLDIKLTVPNTIPANSEYSAILEFEPPTGTIAIASLAADKVEYPQGQTKEVFRTLPEDNILERLFTANNDRVNEYIVASIGLTKTEFSDVNINLSLTGFGYAIKRVNVTPMEEEKISANGEANVQNR
ncbi:hypothetical protein IJD34_08265 [bacterium]|nr:hypothetical protein [bacterium]